MLVWCDIETTGLDPRRDRILEVGLIGTTDSLEELWRVSRVCRFLGDWDRLHPAVREMHAKSGLWSECAVAEATCRTVEIELVALVTGELTPAGLGKVPLCGSTIGFDRSFLAEQMPELLRCFHYRSVDVSTLTELARRWYPAAYESRPGANEAKKPHRVLKDLDQSIAALRHYRERVFVPLSAPSEL